MKHLKKTAISLLMTVSCLNVNAQAAENINLNVPMPASYACYGSLANGCPNAEALGWKVGIQYYTFHKMTFFEAIELTRALGLHYIEATIGARLTKNGPGIGPGMKSAEREMLKNMLRKNGVKCESIYWWMNGSGDGFEDLVKFCAEMGWTIVTDPKRENKGGKPVSFYENILNKYGVRMVFTNHPKGAAYWNPDFTVEDVKGRTGAIGASVDYGHYMRGGFDATDAAIRYMDLGKMYHFHMRDVSEIGRAGLDVPCGQGAGRLREMYQQLHDRNIRPLMMLEYEHDFHNPIPYLIESVNYINKVCGEMIAADRRAAQLGDSIHLWASEAKLAGEKGIRLQDSGKEATIHGWVNSKQSISWQQELKPGRYEVLMRYSQPYSGSAFTLTADGQEMASLVKPTFTWLQYTLNHIGVIDIPTGGNVTISLRAIQAGIKVDKKGKRTQNEALPDINELILVPTSLAATSQPVDIVNTKDNGTPLFNGKNWNGWEPNCEAAQEHFRIEKKCIVGGNMKDDLAKNQFMRTQKRYKDFELRLKYKVVACDGDYNGGIQFRSEPQTSKGNEHEMVGYQADIISWKKGALYDEQRRWTFLGLPQDEPQNYKADKWNDYVIRCEGNRVRIWLNGVKTTDYIEPYTDDVCEGIGTMPQEGHIALQIHQGKACEMWYKDITIKQLQ